MSSRTVIPGLVVACIAILFIFRYQFEMRPVVFSLLFLGVYWNILPWLVIGSDERDKRKRIASVLLILPCNGFGANAKGCIFSVYFMRLL